MGVKIVERVNVVVPMDPYLSLRALSQYCGLSTRTLRGYVNTLDGPLPVYRLRGKVLVRKSEFDSWMAQHRSVGKPSLLVALQEAAPRSLRTRTRSLTFPRTSGVADAAQKAGN